MPPVLNTQNNQEIDKALKEFEAKSQAEQKQKTPEVEQVSDVPKMVQLVMKWSGFKEQKQAEYVLLGFVVTAIGVSLFLFFLKGGAIKKNVNVEPGPELMLIEVPSKI